MNTVALDTADVIDKLHDVRALILSAAALIDVDSDDTTFRVLHQAADKALNVAHLIDAAPVVMAEGGPA